MSVEGRNTGSSPVSTTWEEKKKRKQRLVQKSSRDYISTTNLVALFVAQTKDVITEEKRNREVGKFLEKIATEIW